MSRKSILFALGAVVAGLVALVVGVRAALATDAARDAIAQQVSAAIGQPVSIGAIGASVFPRITVDLQDVAIGRPVAVRIPEMHLSAGLAGVFSRRIDEAAVRVTGARIELPLPTLVPAGTSGPVEAGEPALTLGSVREITITDATITSGSRSLSGTIEIVPEGSGYRICRASLAAGEMAAEVSGLVTSLDPIEGRLDVTAEAVDFDTLLAFMNDFAGTSSPAAVPDPPATDGQIRAVPLGARLVFGLTLGRAETGGLVMTALSAMAEATPDGITLDPIAFDVFGGRYEGTLTVSLGLPPRFTWRASVSRINAGELMRFAGAPDAVTDTLSGTVALEGEGLDMDGALRSSRGTARVDVTDGVLAGLSLVRPIVTGLSGRGGLAASATAAAAAPARDGDAETFSALGATLSLAGGVLRTADFRMTSPDVDVSAAGSMTVASLDTELAARVRLSETLTRESGPDLRRYAAEDGRVTVPATITGPLDRLAVRLDLGDAASRALRNRATEEANKALEKLPGGLGGLLRRPGRRGGGGGGHDVP